MMSRTARCSAQAAPETIPNVSRGDFEFIEIENTGTEIVGLAGLRLDGGISFDFLEGNVQTLAPGDTVVVVRNLAAFTNRYPDWITMNIAGEFDGALDDNGDKIILEENSGTNIFSFTYNDAAGWPLTADGTGHSLVPLLFSQLLPNLSQFRRLQIKFDSTVRCLLTQIVKYGGQFLQRIAKLRQILPQVF